MQMFSILIVDNKEYNKRERERERDSAVNKIGLVE